MVSNNNDGIEEGAHCSFFKRIGFIEVRKRVAKNKTKNYCYGNGFFLLLLLLLEDKPWNFGIHWIIIIVVYFLFREKIIINFSRKNSHCWRKWCSSSIFKSSLLFLFVF